MDQVRIDAAKAGLIKYEGKPCQTCGSVLRFVRSGNCVSCSYKHSKKYRDRVRQEINQAMEGAK